jgi:hypothetical protein
VLSRIRESRFSKLISIYFILRILFFDIAIFGLYSLTGGPAQPEFSSFTPINVNEMVDLSSGDVNYNIPLIDVGGYPVNISYSSNVGMDQESSWVGLGWNLSIGQINHNVRGLPDDFHGEEMIYKNYMQPNYTLAGTFKLTPNVFGKEIDIKKLTTAKQNSSAGSFSYGFTASYNNYNGFELKPNIGIQKSFGDMVSINFNAESSKDGINLEPSMSYDRKSNETKKYNTDLGGKVGCVFNSRQGVSELTLGASKKANQQHANKVRNKINHSTNGSIGGTISFTDPVYTPSVRNGISTESFSVNAAIGSEFFGGEVQGQITAFGNLQSILPAYHTTKVKAYGYNYTKKASNYDVLDFNREKETAISKNTVNLPVTNQTYDIHSIQGQGISGMYRPYLSEVGYVFDTYSTDNNFSVNVGIEAGVGNAVHSGYDLGGTVVNGHSGNWYNSTLKYFHTDYKKVSADHEDFYYKNVGELSYDEELNSSNGMVGILLNESPIRMKIVGVEFYKSITNSFLDFEDKSHFIYQNIHRKNRKNRNQNIKHFTFKELKDLASANKKIDISNHINLAQITQDKQIGLIEITRNDGASYSYGLPVFNTTKQELSFSVNETPTSDGLVHYSDNIKTAITGTSRNEFKLLPNNKNYNASITPSYVHTHLLTGIKSSDYIDVTNNGFTEDDLGSYTAFDYFNYKELTNNKRDKYKWRIPVKENYATYSEGLKTDPLDDQGSILYGEKEIYMIKTIRTKTHVAVFNLSTTQRSDGYGVKSIHGGVDVEAPSFALKSIDLYSIEDYNKKTDSNPNNDSKISPIKTVVFEYETNSNKTLCKGIENGLDANTGKLTLKSIYFTYRNSKMGKYSKYKFSYSEKNPSYSIKGYDSWGNYKEYSTSTADPLKNTSSPLASEHPYVNQDDNLQDDRSESWLLNKVELPSGGTIDIKYESDDYQYVQNQKALRMYTIKGALNELSDTSNFSVINNSKEETLFTNKNDHKKYFVVSIPQINKSNEEIKKLLLENISRNKNLIQFKIFTNMQRQGATSLDSPCYDYVYGYAKINPDDSYVFLNKTHFAIGLEMEENEGGLVKGLSWKGNKITVQKNRNPMVVSTWNFARKHLNKYAYSNAASSKYSDPENIDAGDLAKELFTSQTLNNLLEIFMGPNKVLEDKLVGSKIIRSKSILRLNEITGSKKGSGSRVSKVTSSDLWEKMTGDDPTKGYITRNYGQTYSYKLADGTSSGVATYEPVGNKENPFVQAITISTKHLLAPDDVNYMETPYGESFFPSPQVTYSKVSVTNLAGEPTESESINILRKTGHVVNEFYTSYDYPTITSNTIMDPKPKFQDLMHSLLHLPLYTKNQFAASQGYVIRLNDMNGKQKSQHVFSEGQQEAISSVVYKYIVPNLNDENTRITMLFPDGKIMKQYSGIEMDVSNDFKESETNSKVISTQGNVGSFLFGFFPFVLPTVFGKIKISQNQLRTASTTKVINSFGILSETIAYEDGSSVSTKNLAWDALTGEVLLTQTTDEFNDPYYTLNYPAHWAYDRMGPISKNIGFTSYITSEINGNVVFTNGKTGIGNYFVDGDEVLLTSGSTKKYLWVTNVTPNAIELIDENGDKISVDQNVLNQVTIVRSGRKNLQSAGIMNVMLKQNPLIHPVDETLLTTIDKNFLVNTFDAQNEFISNYKVISAGAVLYSDYWPATCECNESNSKNPYINNTRGIWRTKASYTYLTSREYESTTCRNNGFYKHFTPFYTKDVYGKFYLNMKDWTFVSEVTKYASVGNEIENKDALDRYSGALFGFNNKLPMAVGANTKYEELVFESFEDYGYNSCATNPHFSFKEASNFSISNIVNKSHSGENALRVGAGQSLKVNKQIQCNDKKFVIVNSSYWNTCPKILSFSLYE